MTSTALTLLPVIIIYRCRWQEAQSVKSMLSHYSGVIYVGDNSPATFEVDLEELPENVIYNRTTDNPGLPYHYNAAARYAASHSFTHLLLLDQDTLFPPNALELYLQQPKDTIIAAPSLFTQSGSFSPATIDAWNIKAVTLSPGMHSLYKFSPVNSGLLLRVKEFLYVGGYDEKVVLDFSDFQFIRRLRKYIAYFTLLPFTAQQDFSNHQKNSSLLLPRFKLYLMSARNCEFDTEILKWKHHYQILHHSIALTLRTRSLRFLTTLVTKYIFQI